MSCMCAERARALLALQAAGAERVRALAEAAASMDRIAALVPAALACGATMTECAKSAGVTRPTLYAHRAGPS